MERYGITLTDHELQDLLRKIRVGEGTFVARVTNRISAWDLVTEAGVTLRVLYDKQRHQIATCLPPDATFDGNCQSYPWGDRLLKEHE